MKRLYERLNDHDMICAKIYVASIGDKEKVFDCMNCAIRWLKENKPRWSREKQLARIRTKITDHVVIEKNRRALLKISALVVP